MKPQHYLRFVRIAALVAAAALAGPVQGAQEWGIDRPGGDYKSFDLPADQPSLCEHQCAIEGQCQAWTFVHPGVQGPQARCWLKSTVPAAVQNTCCVSGVKQVSTGSFEVDRDRPGLDYKSFDLPAAQPQLCQQACLSEGQCRAWTYVKPGVQGPAARCWLKSDVPASKIDSCCVSGVK
jgi:hypothetical protein